MNRALKALATVALSLLLLLAAIEFLKHLGTGGILIVIAILVTYLILPIVNFFRRRMAVIWALLLTYLVIAIIAAGALLGIVPRLVEQAHSLVLSLPSLVQTLQRELADPKNPIIAKAPPEVRTYLVELPTEIRGLIAKYGLGVAQQTIGVVISAASLFLALVIVPILSGYMLLDSTEVKRAFLGFIPQAHREKALAILNDLNKVVAAFVQGQVTDGMILGALVAIMLAIMHVPYALLIGVIAGFLNLVPYLGAIISFVPAVILALAVNGWENALIVAILFAVLQQIDGNFILPRIMKSSVQLSPLVIVIAIIVFSALFGVMGAFIAVPVAAMLRVLKLHFAPEPSEVEMTREELKAQRLSML
ncbi:MAG: AI-2E family transporter [Vulcanimicrobiaceae bacterium]